MTISQTAKQLKNLCESFLKETEIDLDDYNNPAFTEWLEASYPLRNKKSRGKYTVLEQKAFARSIMDAYVTAMNEISKKLDFQNKEHLFTKDEVMEIVFEGFGIAKTQGEKNISLQNDTK